MCFARLLECENALPHALQTCGFSPECVRVCTVRALDVLNDLPHKKASFGAKTMFFANTKEGVLWCKHQ